MKTGMDLFSVQANKQTVFSTGGSESTLCTNYGSVLTIFTVTIQFIKGTGNGAEK